MASSGMIDELLTLAVVRFRLGQAAAGSVSFEAYLRADGHIESKHDHIVIAAIHAGDFLFAADAIEVCIAPTYKKAAAA